MRTSFHILFLLSVFAINVCDAQQIVRTGEMVVPRSFHTTTLLKDGRVLAIGGIVGAGAVGTKSAEVYDPTNGTWRRVGDMVAQQFFPIAVRLHDGRVLIAGGFSLELFDPTSETFSAAGSVSGSIGAALLLPDGRVLLAGESGNSSALYDPVAGVTATLDGMEVGVPIVLPDGRLVVIGPSSAGIYELKGTSLNLLFRHDLGGTLYQRSAALLPEGNILIAGGGLNPFNGPPSSVAVLYDPRHGTVRATGSLPEAQMLYGITSLSNGSVLTSGGFDVYWADSNYYASPAIYDPSSEQFTSVPIPVTYTATQLQDGRVLVTGADMYTLLGPTAFLYSPAPRPATTGCSYSLDYTSQAFAAEGGTGTISITTGAGCPWTVGSLPAAVKLTSAGSGAGTGSVTFQVLPNVGGGASYSFAIADQIFTLEQSASSIPGLAAGGSLGQVTSGGTWDFSLIGINLGASAATARFTFADNNGSPMALPLTFPQLPAIPSPELAATLDRTLNPNAQIVLNSTGPDSAATLVGAGQLLSNGNVGGFGILANPKLKWNAVVPLETRNASRYILAFDNTAPLTTGVAVANLAAQAANVPVIIRDDTGTQIGNPMISLSALGHTSFMVNDPTLGFPVTNNRRGTVEFVTPPGGKISVLGLRANGAALTTLPVLADTDAAGGSITHVTYNEGWTSVFYLVNTGNASAQFTLSFFDESGSALPVPLLLPQSGTNLTTPALTQALAAGAMLVINTQAQDAPGTLVVGSAKMTTTGNIGGFEIFRWTTFGQEASVPLESRTPNSFVLVFDDTNGLTTGVALANQNAAAANVTARIYDDAGRLLQTASINLGSRAHTSFLLPTNYAVTTNKRGMVEFVVPPGTNISAIGLRAKNDGTFMTIPVLTK